MLVPQIFFHNIKMLKLGETKVTKKTFYAAKKTYNNLGY